MVEDARESGWYWVRRWATTADMPGRWSGHNWYLSGAEYAMQDNELHKIGPRIPPPDEPPAPASADAWNDAVEAALVEITVERSGDNNSSYAHRALDAATSRIRALSRSPAPPAVRRDGGSDG